MVKTNLYLIKLIISGLLLAMLAACAGKPSTKPSQPSKEVSQHQYTQAEVVAQIKQLELAEMFAQQGEYLQSLEIIDTLTTQLLPQEFFWRALEVSATSSLAENNGWLALKHIEHFSQGQKSLTRNQFFKLFEFKADALLLTGHLEEAISQRFNQAEAAPSSALKTSSYASLWQNLLLLDKPALTGQYIKARQAEPKGWYELALVRQSLAEQPEEFNPKWQAWQQRWPNHSAQSFMPEEMPKLAKLAQIKINHVGVFLPQEGALVPAAKAIQNSLIAAQLNLLNSGQAAPKLSFFNTHNQSLDQLYQQAKQQGVEVVIGPLAKAQVTVLEKMSRPPLPTLALNYGNANKTSSNFFQLGLSAENEAEDLAKKAWLSGFRHALVLTPEDSWGSRVEQSFIKEWQRLGGQVDLTKQYGKTRSIDKSLRELLEVELSQQRHQKITRLLGQRPHFTPHSREDSDFLFIHATPNNARQIKPALKFLMAGDLPVLATSSIYNGQTNPNLDKDMDGLIFCDIPWYLEETSSLINQLRQAWPNEMQNYGRLYALGQDAYFLALRLHLLTAMPNASFKGATGKLSQSQGIFKRELAWAEFSQGRAVHLPAARLEEKFLAPANN